MESVIREGALRLLTTETSCDVILSCQGHRLMAHKLILSMASPVFRGLLSDDSSDPTVFILPDINGSIMSLILDYIYTGSVVVYSNTLQDFISVASLLKIHLDVDSSKGYLTKHGKLFQRSPSPPKCHFKADLVKKNEDAVYQEKVESSDVESASNPEVYSKKNQRKLPSLLPINKLQPKEGLKSKRKLCSYVLPSPWCPRIERIFGDPRNDCLESYENQISPPVHPLNVEENDSNNNFKRYSNYSPINYNTTKSIPHIYQKNLRKLDTSPKSSALGIFSFEAHILNKLNNSCSPNNHVSKQTDNFSTKNENSKSSIVENRKFQPSCDNVLKRSNVDVVSEEESSVSCKNNSFRSSVKDSDSSQSNSEGELSKTGEEFKLDSNEKKQKPFKCEDCGKSFSQLRNYKYHRSVHEGTKEFAAKCPECGKVFNDRGYLSSHMKIHRDKKEYACPHCPKRFNQRVAYNMHLRIHTGVKPHECSVCGKSFSRKMLLKQHQRVHTGERPYSCPECGKTFADRSNMSLHARLHTGVKPYSCSLCSKSFTKKHHLKTHMNFHTGLKPYTCEKCGLAFSQSSNMRTHYKKCILKTDTGNTSASEAQKDSS